MKRRRSMLARMASGGLLAVAILGACSSGEPTESESTPGDDGVHQATGSFNLAFGECGDLVDLASAQFSSERAEQLTFECADLDVPLDYHHPGGEKIAIAVVRIRDSRQVDRLGSLVMNPGGPGQSGLGYAAYWASWLPAEITERFDVVTFDPRGVGASQGIDCGPLAEDNELDVYPDLLSAKGYAYAAHYLQREAAGCIGGLGGQERAQFFNTSATAQDLDFLREALGDEKLTYLGFSYGARLGGQYARRFPEQIRAMVLDAPADPSSRWIAGVRRQAGGFERSLAAWAEDCPNRESCGSLGTHPRKFISDLMSRADKSPIPSHRSTDDVSATAATILAAALNLLYSKDTWALLDAALAEADAGDSGSIREATEAFTGNPHDEIPDPTDAGLVINCNDTEAGPSKQAIVSAAREMTQQFPYFGRYFSWGLMGCKFWPAQRHPDKPPSAEGASPILVIGTRNDPATPYRGAVHFAKALGSPGHLLTWEGQSHTAYGQTDCITGAVDKYLLTLTLPAHDPHCPA